MESQVPGTRCTHQSPALAVLRECRGLMQRLNYADAKWQATR
jgi:hypothetical protein